MKPLIHGTSAFEVTYHEWLQSIKCKLKSQLCRERERERQREGEIIFKKGGKQETEINYLSLKKLHVESQTKIFISCQYRGK